MESDRATKTKSYLGAGTISAWFAGSPSEYNHWCMHIGFSNLQTAISSYTSTKKRCLFPLCYGYSVSIIWPLLIYMAMWPVTTGPGFVTNIIWTNEALTHMLSLLLSSSNGTTFGHQNIMMWPEIKSIVYNPCALYCHMRMSNSLLELEVMWHANYIYLIFPNQVKCILLKTLLNVICSFFTDHLTLWQDYINVG